MTIILRLLSCVFAAVASRYKPVYTTFITAWISYYIHQISQIMRDEIPYPFHTRLGSCWSLGMGRKFHSTPHWTCDYVSMPGLKLIYVSKGSPGCKHQTLPTQRYVCCVHKQHLEVFGQVMWGSLVLWYYWLWWSMYFDNEKFTCLDINDMSVL